MAAWVDQAVPLMEQAFRDLETYKNAQDWELTEENAHQKIYTRPYADNVIAKSETIFNRSAEEVYNVICNISHEKRWGQGNNSNPFVKGPKKVEILDEHQNYILICVELMNQWPIDNREIIYVHTRRVEGNSYIFLEKSLDAEDVPVTEGCVRAAINFYGLVITPNGDNQCIATYFVQFDPQGNVPSVGKRKIQIGWAKLIPDIIHTLIE